MQWGGRTDCRPTVHQSSRMEALPCPHLHHRTAHQHHCPGPAQGRAPCDLPARSRRTGRRSRRPGVGGADAVATATRGGVRALRCTACPSLWRALPVALGPDVASWTSLSERTIADRLEAVRPALRAQHLDAPSAMIVHTLIAVCGPARLQQLVARHANPERWGSPGVPDLFLFRRDTTGRITSARFVEVKRPREPFRPGQEDELAFLQSIGLHARVLRLIERPLRSDSVADTSVTPPGEREA
jgi:hypothetical protein